MKKLVFLACSVFAAMNLCAQTTSTQAHDSMVSALCTMETSDKLNDSFYSAGDDGFLIKWDDSGMGDHYQISTMKIKSISRNPSTGDVALYETDGVSLHRVTVINSKTFAKIFSRRFPDPVTSISFSEKGTYLFVGSNTANGTYIINSKDGKIYVKPDDVSGGVTFAQTGASEKSAVMYSKNGYIYYYDLIGKKRKTRFSTEKNLTQAVLFGSGKMNNRFIAGVKDGSIYIIDATSGTTLSTYPATDTFILSAKNKSDPNKQGLYYITNVNRNYNLMCIGESALENLVQKSGNTQPSLIKKFTGLRGGETFTSGAKIIGKVILGTSQGNIYTMTDVPESEMYSLFAMTENMYEKINDIAKDNTDFFFLTDKIIFRTNYEKKNTEQVAVISGYTNIEIQKNNAILWSKGTRKTVVSLDITQNDSVPKSLFTPTAPMNTLKFFDDRIVYTQGSSSVGVYNITKKTNSEVYTGTSIQDAVLIDNKTIYVAKTKTGDKDSPVISVDINTRETLPLPFKGTIAFSLSYDYNKPDSKVYGMSIISGNGTNTEVFAYSPKEKIYAPLLRYPEEDANAFTEVLLPTLLTNIGKKEVRSIDIDSRKAVILKRSSAMPSKAAILNGMVAILNTNGSITWYKIKDQNILADWYLTVDGQWMDLKK